MLYLRQLGILSNAVVLFFVCAFRQTILVNIISLKLNLFATNVHLSVKLYKLKYT